MRRAGGGRARRTGRLHPAPGNRRPAPGRLLPFGDPARRTGAGAPAAGRDAAGSRSDDLGFGRRRAALRVARAGSRDWRSTSRRPKSDWKKHAELAQDKTAARMALAGFYHRRLRPADEIEALRSAEAFERGIAVAAAHALPPAVTTSLYRAWMARSPGEPEVYRRFLEYLTAQRDWPAAEKLLAEYAQAFPADQTFPVRARAALERRRGSPDRAIAVYDQAFRPLWPAELAKEHIALLAPESRAAQVFRARARPGGGESAGPRAGRAAVLLPSAAVQPGRGPARAERFPPAQGSAQGRLERGRVAGPGPPVRSGPQLRRSGAVLPRAVQPAGGRARGYRRRAGVAGQPAVERARTTGSLRRRRPVVLQGHRDRR